MSDDHLLDTYEVAYEALLRENARLKHELWKARLALEHAYDALDNFEFAYAYEKTLSTCPF